MSKCLKGFDGFYVFFFAIRLKLFLIYKLLGKKASK